MLHAYEAILDDGQLIWFDPKPKLSKLRVKGSVLPKSNTA